ncbi:MAG: FG-GAP-like repeat-containing protein, partial [Planctomycetaceae bacterium]
MTQSSSPPAAPRPHRRHLWGLLAATAVIVGFLVLRRPRQEPDPVAPPPTVSFTTEELRLLYADRNAAIGEIEGALGAGNLTAALGLLDEIERRLPGDRFPKQNRAVALVMALQVQDKSTSPRVSPDDVLAELDLLKQAEPTNPVPWLLAAHVAEKSGDGEQLLVQGRKAAELAPQDPVAWYALAKAGDYLADDDPARDECRQALTKALALDPENSHLLRLQAKSLAYARDPGVIPVLERLASQTALLDLVRRTDGAKGDPRELITAAIDAVRQEDWPTATVSAERLGNIIMRQDWVRSDLRRLEPNPLNYIALDFHTAVESPAIPLPPLAVPQFTPSKKLAPLASLAPEAPASSPKLELADVDGDGQLDLLVLGDKSLQVFTQAAAGWQPLLEHPLPGQFTRLLIADLDRDESPREQPRPAEPLAPADPRVCGTADPDFVLAGPAGVLMLKNELREEGGRQLVVVPQPEPFAALRDVAAATLVDLDQDGDLD